MRRGDGIEDGGPNALWGVWEAEAADAPRTCAAAVRVLPLLALVSVRKKRLLAVTAKSICPPS